MEQHKGRTASQKPSFTPGKVGNGKTSDPDVRRILLLDFKKRLGQFDTKIVHALGLLQPTKKR